jgi:hypothetical protein
MTSCIRRREFITLVQSSDHPILSEDWRSIRSATLVAFEAAEIGADRNLVGVRWHEDNVGDRIVRKRAEKMEPRAPGVSLTQSTVHFTSELSRPLAERTMTLSALLQSSRFNAHVPHKEAGMAAWRTTSAVAVWPMSNANTAGGTSLTLMRLISLRNVGPGEGS